MVVELAAVETRAISAALPICSERFKRRETCVLCSGKVMVRICVVLLMASSRACHGLSVRCGWLSFLA